MTDCLFCKMVARQIQPAVVYETEQVLAFRDIHPKAPTHVLVIPKKHLPTLNDLAAEDTALAGELLQAVKIVAEQEGLAQSGYRTVINCNGHAGQEVFHLHLHVLGGRTLKWPPG
ncbi:MAG: histidine triad nucleotide-binding protein [Methylococcaceae bacterium]|nr:MAG: histidine triad nucleotide-binding protein [Methylococcaceae bacterium]